MAEMRIRANAEKAYTSQSSESWNRLTSDVSDVLVEWAYNRDEYFALRFPISTVRVTRFDCTIFPQAFEALEPGPSISASLYTDDPFTGTPLATLEDFVRSETSHTFSFTGLAVDAKEYIYLAFHGQDIGSVFGGYLETAFSTLAAVNYTSIPALTPSIVQPRSGSYNAASEILFSWQNSGPGTQTKAVLQWSADGATWQALQTINGSDQTYTAPAGKFPGGTVYWRIQVTSSYGILSNWVQANFTAVYAPATVTLTTPTSGSRNGGESITFAWSINPGAGSVTGTQMEYSTDDGLSWVRLVDASDAVTSYSSSVAQFPEGPLKWHVRAKNNYTDWGAWTQASININYTAVSQIAPVNSPTSGRVNAAASIVFTVNLQASSPVHDPFTVASASFYWRSGTSGDYTELAMTPSGANASVTVPGGTFPSGTIQWYASATDNTGRSTQTTVYTLSTLNAPVEAFPVSPANVVESSGSPITFTWTYSSLDGSEQSAALLEYSRDGTSWSTLANIGGSAKNYTAPAGTFSAGIVYWRVQASNSAGTAGPMSDPAMFTVFGAPSVSGVIGDGKPFLTVSWQVEGQLAYKIEVGGKTYGPYRGKEVRRFTLPEPLPDGTYTARVQAQNRYGLWSEWAEGNVDVKNVHGPTVPFGADSGESVLVSMFLAEEPPVITQQPQDITTNGQATLTTKFIMPNTSFFKCQWFSLAPGATEWQAATSEATVSRPQNGRTLTLSAAQVQTYNGYKFRLRVRSNVGIVYSREALVTYGTPEQTSPLITGYFPSPTGYFLVYRDGVIIGKTYNTRFYDRTALGTHEYYALQVIPDGYYTRSSPTTATATASVKCPMIALLEGGDFLRLELSEDANRTQTITKTGEVKYVQYSGAKYPEAEIGEAESLAVTGDVSFTAEQEADARRFESMLKKAVIYKTPGGEVVVGVLQGFTRRDPRFFKSYTFQVTQMERRDFVNA